jgi:hypothetical protein
MKLINVLDLGVQVALDATDCLAVADALRPQWDGPGNKPHQMALAAADTNMDGETPPRNWRRKTRTVWGAIDTTTLGHPKLTKPPQSELR